MPVPGVVTFEPKALWSVWVVLTIVPSASMTVQLRRVGALTAHETRHLGKLPGGVVARAAALDFGPSPVGIGRGYQLGDGHVDAVRICHVLPPVGERDLERFGEQVDVGRLAEAQTVVADRETAQEIEHLHDVRPARRRRRGRMIS